MSTFPQKGPYHLFFRGKPYVLYSHFEKATASYAGAGLVQRRHQLGNVLPGSLPGH